jgi:hypothetical protein
MDYVRSLGPERNATIDNARDQGKIRDLGGRSSRSIATSTDGFCAQLHQHTSSAHDISGMNYILGFFYFSRQEEHQSMHYPLTGRLAC